MKIRKLQQNFHFVVSIILIVYAIIRIKSSDEAHKDALDIYVSMIVVFGMIVQALLNFLFPLIVLNEKGIKLLGRKMIGWKEISKVDAVDIGEGHTKILICKINNTVIKDEFRNLDREQENLQHIFDSCLRKFGNKSIRE